MTTCPSCRSTDPNRVGVRTINRRDEQCRDPYHCPSPALHGNPFRYCPHCTWTESPQPANPNYNDEPIISKDADGYVSLVWYGPDSCLVHREVLEGFVNDHNRMRLMLADLGAAIEEL